MDFSLSAEQRELMKAAADFARRELNRDMSTRAERRGEHYVPKGTTQYISAAGGGQVGRSGQSPASWCADR